MRGTANSALVTHWAGDQVAVSKQEQGSALTKQSGMCMLAGEGVAAGI